MQPSLTKQLFWDVDFKSIDFNKHAPFVVERVLSMGTLDDFQKIKSYYGKPALKKIVKNLRYLDDRTLSFCCVYFNIKPSFLRCYKQKQLNKGHWTS